MLFLNPHLADEQPNVSGLALLAKKLQTTVLAQGHHGTGQRKNLGSGMGCPLMSRLQGANSWGFAGQTGAL
jgi:hypothetical protein